MGSSSREDIVEVFDALDADVDRVCELSFEALTTPELLGMLERLEKVARRLPVPGRGLINQLVQQAAPQELGGKLGHALADRLRITRGDANRRVAEAADLGPRRALTGQPLAPRLTATAALQGDGQLGAGHVGGDSWVLRAAALLGRRADPRERRGGSGQSGHRASSRSVAQAG
jgi:Domain of unknown function (DUF222)